MDQTGRSSTFCNPINLAYRYQPPSDHAGSAHREAADPSIVLYRGRLWLFASKSGGYWYSDDMMEWTFVSSSALPTEDYAPDVRVIDDWIYFTASRRASACPIYRTRTPELDQWELVGEHMTYWDPNLFVDDDGRVYLYYGCSNNEPLYGVELDGRTMAPMGERVVVLANHRQAEMGWHRFGECNEGSGPPWMEGAWMTKHEGKYYLQYAAPGTEFNVYADGVAVSDQPLGPFEDAAHNPFSMKAGGYAGGAGHGSTFQDRHGNWWHASTICISVNHRFERRLGIWPAGFDADGVLFCNTRFGDFPISRPDRPFDPWRETSPKWWLLSYAKPVRASSSRRDHGPEKAVDESIQTWWAAESRIADAGQPWLEIDLQDVAQVHAFQINFADEQATQCLESGEPLRHRYRLEGSLDGLQWITLIDKRDSAQDTPHDYLTLTAPQSVRHVRLTIAETAGGGRPAVSGLRVFGLAPGPAPAQPDPLVVDRSPDDPCVATLRWKPVANAVGYNVRWGAQPDKLYNTWQVFESTELTMRCLLARQDHWFTIEAFNGAGVSSVAEPILAAAP